MVASVPMATSSGLPVLAVIRGQSAFAVLAVLLQVVLNSAKAAPPSPSPHEVVRSIGEILVWVEKNENKSDGGLIEQRRSALTL
jgi:formate-dependent nitrite reductase membrane component NrfD